MQGSSSQDSVIRKEGGTFSVSGNNLTRVFLVQEYGDLTINNLTITDGAGTNGGAIKVDDGGILSLSAVTVNDSKASTGAGGGIRSIGALTIANSAIHCNTGNGVGGGVSIEGSATITYTSIYSNRSVTTSSGGGVSVHGASNITINQSSIYSNTADLGAGIYVAGDVALSLKNSTAFSNTAGNGAGLFNGGNGTATVSQVTFADNRATNLTGVGVRRNDGTLRLRNTIIAITTSDGATRPGDCSGTLDQNRDNLIEDGSCSAEHSGDPSLASTTTGSPPITRWTTTVRLSARATISIAAKNPPTRPAVAARRPVVISARLRTAAQSR